MSKFREWLEKKDLNEEILDESKEIDSLLKKVKEIYDLFDKNKKDLGDTRIFCQSKLTEIILALNKLNEK